uniref:Uncharacterized protein n=1 Tax=Anguilla anguilla TaxID=7936 RepID=A0A0E9WWL0_ANGAN
MRKCTLMNSVQVQPHKIFSKNIFFIYTRNFFKLHPGAFSKPRAWGSSVLPCSIHIMPSELWCLILRTRWHQNHVSFLLTFQTLCT